jgi:hypothetical protein
MGIGCNIWKTTGLHARIVNYVRELEPVNNQARRAADQFGGIYA